MSDWTLLQRDENGKLIWPANPKLFEQVGYINPFGGASWLIYEWCGVAGWRFVRDE
jgi:hypothetical protein